MHPSEKYPASAGGQHVAPATDGPAVAGSATTPAVPADAPLGTHLLAAAHEVYADARRAGASRWNGQVAVGRWFRALPRSLRAEVGAELVRRGDEYGDASERATRWHLEDLVAGPAELEEPAAGLPAGGPATGEPVATAGEPSKPVIAPQEGVGDPAVAIPAGVQALAAAGIATLSGGAPAEPAVPTKPGWWWWATPHWGSSEAVEIRLHNDGQLAVHSGNGGHCFVKGIPAKWWIGPVEPYRPVPYTELVKAMRAARSLLRGGTFGSEETEQMVEDAFAILDRIDAGHAQPAPQGEVR